MKTFIRSSPEKDVEIMTLYELFQDESRYDWSRVNAVGHAFISISRSSALRGKNSTEDGDETIFSEIARIEKSLDVFFE